MKLSKRFSSLKKSLGLTLLASIITPSLLILYSCKNSFLPEPTAFGLETPTAKLISSPLGLTATHGGKRKITLSWNPVDKAKWYRVYGAQSPSEEFILINDYVTKTTFDDSVSAGRTMYYRITAVTNDGKESNFSPIVKGASLATPLISAVEVHDNTTTLFWYMENSVSYSSSLRFNIHCDGGGASYEQTVTGDKDSYTFENLNANTNYYYFIEAYLFENPTAIEKSVTVDAQTAMNYTPQAPNFAASKGTSKSELTLNIKLPSKVQVQIANDSYDFPLRFEIWRKMSTQPDADYTKVVPILYYNGSTTTQPTSYDYNPDDIIQWTDTDVTRGIKYTYRIKSYVDENFASSIGKTLSSVIGSRTYTYSEGWLSARPTFELSEPEKHLNAGGTAIESTLITFNLEWEDFGVASNYRFAIKEKRAKFKADNGGVEDTSNVWNWISSSGKDLFDSIASVNSFKREFDLSQNPETIRGLYEYKLYIIPAEYTSAASGEANALEWVNALGTIPVTDSIELPQANLAVQGGWKSKIEITYGKEDGGIQDGVEYELKRTLLKEDGSEDGAPTPIVPKINEAYTGAYTDTSVESGKTYVYILTATKDGLSQPSAPCKVQTLGTPFPSFNPNAVDYDSVAISWKKVPAAKTYTITLGEQASDLGGGKTLTLDSNGNIDENSQLKGTAYYQSGEFTLRISEPTGYDIASISGENTKLIITASSDQDSANGNVLARTLGPAKTELKGTKDLNYLKKSEIKITWQEVPGAVGYAVSRKRPAIGSLSEKTDVYFVNAEGPALKQDGDSVDAKTASVKRSAEGLFTLIDTQTKATDSTSSWQLNQERIAWGVPFTYTVLPVLSEDDASTVEDFKVSYTAESLKSIQKDGYTWGYGTEVTASKAEDAKAIKITWKEAASEANGYVPTILYRVPGSGSWTYINQSTQGNYETESGANTKSFNWTGVPDDLRCDCLEFSVSYDPNISNGASASVRAYKYENSYISYMTSQIDSDGEQNNWGYLFSLPSLVTKTSMTDKYQEQVDWDLYDQNARKKAPGDGMTTDPYTLYIKNMNLDDTWHPIATFSTTGKHTFIENETIGKNKKPYLLTTNCEQESGKMIVTLSPSDVSATIDGTHEGLLKVLRDPRHYYKLTAVRNGANGEVETELGEDMTYFACRQITNKEKVRAALLVIAYAFYKNGGGTDSLSNVTEKYKYNGETNIKAYEYEDDNVLNTRYGGNNGTGTFGKRSLISAILWDSEVGKYKADVSLANYGPGMLTPGGSYSSMIAVTMTNVNTRTKGLSDPYFDKFRTEGFSVSFEAANTDIPTTLNYKGSFTMTCTSPSYLKVTIGSNTYEAKNTADRRKLLPMQISDDDGQCWIKDVGYGWWEE